MMILAHVVDSVFGQSAAGVPSRLFRAEDDDWIALSATETDYGGRILAWERMPLETGTYRIILDSSSYFSGVGSTTAYPEVVIIFRADTEYATLQLQVALSPYSFTANLARSDPARGY